MAGSSRPRMPDGRMSHVINRVPEVLSEGRPDPSWERRASCTGIKDWEEVFFAPPDRKITQRYYFKAYDICGQCPVAAECLVTAMLDERATPQDSIYGVFGGLIGRERVALAKAYGLRGELRVVA